jgi:ribonucleotide monophosphatase NagD (HAD superfamily)
VDTDGQLAKRLGYRFALVLTGVITSDEVASVEPKPDEVAPDLASLVDRYGTRG